MRLKTKIISFFAAVGFMSSLFVGVSHAGTGLIYISPASTSQEVGSTFSVALRINPGTAVNAAQATVGYDPSQLQWISNSIGTFSTCAQNSGGGGAVNLACAILGGSTSGDSLIADISFKALAGSGSTALTVSNAEAANGGSYTDPGSAGGSVSFYSPAPPPSSGSSGSGGSTSSGGYSYHTGSSSPTTATQPTKTAASVPAVKIKILSVKPEFNSAGVNIKLSAATQAWLQYGTSKLDLSQSTQPIIINKTGTLTSGNNLIPGTAYYYKVITKDAQGNISQSNIKSFTTKGFTVSVTILDSQNHPLAGQLVTLHSNPITVKTNGQGVATFADVAPGVHHLIYSAGSKTYDETVYVNNDFTTRGQIETASAQTAAVILSNFVQPKSNVWILEVAAVFCFVVFAGAGFRFLMPAHATNHKKHGKTTRLKRVWAHSSNHSDEK